MLKGWNETASVLCSITKLGTRTTLGRDRWARMLKMSKKNGEARRINSGKNCEFRSV